MSMVIDMIVHYLEDDKIKSFTDVTRIEFTNGKFIVELPNGETEDKPIKMLLGVLED